MLKDVKSLAKWDGDERNHSCGVDPVYGQTFVVADDLAQQTLMQYYVH